MKNKHSGLDLSEFGRIRLENIGKTTTILYEMRLAGKSRIPALFGDIERIRLKSNAPSVYSRRRFLYWNIIYNYYMSLNEGKIISFLVRQDDSKEFKRIADKLYILGRLKKPSVGLMCKRFLYVMANQYMFLEAQTPYFGQKQ